MLKLSLTLHTFSITGSVAGLFLTIKILSRYTIMYPIWIKFPSILFIILWNVASALKNPKYMNCYGILWILTFFFFFYLFFLILYFFSFEFLFLFFFFIDDEEAHDIAVT